MIHGYKPKEIAERYGLSVHAVKQWRRQVLIKLKREVPVTSRDLSN
ncbi:sigma-70 RNA polymerase sigma factor region 4 domain-containing protein [Bacillus shivajii]